MFENITARVGKKLQHVLEKNKLQHMFEKKITAHI